MATHRESITIHFNNVFPVEGNGLQDELVHLVDLKTLFDGRSGRRSNRFLVETDHVSRGERSGKMDEKQ